MQAAEDEAPIARENEIALLLAAAETQLAAHDSAGAAWVLDRAADLLRHIPGDSSEASAWIGRSRVRCLELLARCFLADGKPAKARSILQGVSEPELRFHLAVACFRLNDLEGCEKALLGTNSPAGAPEPASSAAPAIPNGAAGLQLLGRVCVRSGRRPEAETHFRAALALDPLCWSALRELAALGAKLEPEQLFQFGEAYLRELVPANEAETDSQHEEGEGGELGSHRHSMGFGSPSPPPRTDARGAHPELASLVRLPHHHRLASTGSTASTLAPGDDFESTPQPSSAASLLPRQQPARRQGLKRSSLQQRELAAETPSPVPGPSSTATAAASISTASPGGIPLPSRARSRRALLAGSPGETPRAPQSPRSAATPALTTPSSPRGHGGHLRHRLLHRHTAAGSPLSAAAAVRSPVPNTPNSPSAAAGAGSLAGGVQPPRQPQPQPVGVRRHARQPSQDQPQRSVAGSARMQRISSRLNFDLSSPESPQSSAASASTSVARVTRSQSRRQQQQSEHSRSSSLGAIAETPSDDSVVRRPVFPSRLRQPANLARASSPGSPSNGSPMMRPSSSAMRIAASQKSPSAASDSSEGSGRRHEKKLKKRHPSSVTSPQSTPTAVDDRDDEDHDLPTPRSPMAADDEVFTPRSAAPTAATSALLQPSTAGVSSLRQHPRHPQHHQHQQHSQHLQRSQKPSLHHPLFDPHFRRVPKQQTRINPADFEGLATQLRSLVRGYLLLADYRCEEAIEVFDSLAPHWSRSVWQMKLRARALFELAEYPAAARLYRHCSSAQPHCLEGLEYFSTALWHLRHPVELSGLAQDLLGFDRMAPETWVVLGNLFSLQKEHETALKFFKRAIQLDPWSPYAYTLCAHEQVACEDFDKAVTGYRMAMSLDPRHYNAWWGMGSILKMQQQPQSAVYHFQRAAQISPRNPVLQCHLGLALRASDRPEEALRGLLDAERLRPRDPMIKFQLATLFHGQGDLQTALRRLHQAAALVNTEASIHFLMGNIYQALGQPNKALWAYLQAWDLDPKDPAIRAAVLQLPAGHDAVRADLVLSDHEEDAVYEDAEYDGDDGDADGADGAAAAHGGYGSEEMEVEPADDELAEEEAEWQLQQQRRPQRRAAEGDSFYEDEDEEIHGLDYSR